MKPKVYLETTVISYLTAWPSRDVIMHGHQQSTREWWVDRRENFDLCISQLVLDEAGAGDPQAAHERLEVLAAIPMLPTVPAISELAKALLNMGAIPSKAGDDAIHLAYAAVHGVDYLLTWNCRHLANAIMRPNIEAVCRASGYRPPIICNPDELMGS
jgi:hypothetical protein